MLVAFWRWWKLLSISAQKTAKEIFVKICWPLKTPTRTWKCTMQMSYLYASDFPFKNFLQIRQTNRNNKKLSKQGLVMIKHCLGKLTN